MSKTPLVSIILPTYNGSRYLEQAIQSCLEQTYQNWELIIVDDASADSTSEIIARYLSKDERIRSIRHDRNRKLPAALNSGFSQAKGIYLTWTSDDNCYRTSAIAEMVSFLESHSETDIVYADYTIIDEDGCIVKSVNVGVPSDIYLGNCIGPCFLYSRKVLEKLRTHAEDLFLAEDYDFWLRASISFTFHPIHIDLYLYRYHETSLTMQKMKGVLKATEWSLKRNFSQMHWLRQDIQAKSWINLASGALASNNIRLARKYLLYAIACSPAFVYRNNYDLMISNQQLAEKDSILDEKNKLLAEMDSLLAEKGLQIQTLKNSLNWKITSPLRRLRSFLVNRII